jgi:drug/metabolite transporter (DMT)-like permease
MIAVLTSLILLVSVSEAIAQFCLRSAVDNNKHCHKLIIIGLLGYLAVAWLLYKTYKFSNLGHTNLIWSCVSIVIAFAVGFSFFQEKLDKHALVAIVAAFVAIYFAHRSTELNKNQQVTQ